MKLIITLCLTIIAMSSNAQVTIKPTQSDSINNNIDISTLLKKIESPIEVSQCFKKVFEKENADGSKSKISYKIKLDHESDARTIEAIDIDDLRKMNAEIQDFLVTVQNSPRLKEFIEALKKAEQLNQEISRN